MISPEQAQDLIARSRGSGGGWSGRQLIALGFALAAGWMLVTASGSVGMFADPGMVLLLLLCGLTGWTWRQAARQREALSRLVAAGEAMQLQDYPRAEATVTTLLSSPVRPVPGRPVRIEALLLLAALAEWTRRFDAAQVVYEAIVGDPQTDAGHQCVASIGLAGSMLRNDQLADAVGLIERLQRSTLPDKLKAHVEMVSLYREVVMGQTDRIIEAAPQRRELFRTHLSTRAGYGYALCAVGFARAGDTEQARRTWRDATMLVQPDRLAREYDEVKPIAAELVPAPQPFTDVPGPR